MATLADIRQQYPQYGDMSDAALADALHKKFYSDMPRDQFDAKIGFKPASAQPAPELKPGTNNVGLTDFLKQGATFGLADEVGAAGAATGGALKSIVGSVKAGQMPNWADVKNAAGDAYDRRLSAQREGMKAYAEENPIASTAAELAGGLGLGGLMSRAGATFLNAAKPTYASMIGRGAAEGALYGGAYGFGSGEGGLQNRLENAAGGAATGALTGAATGAIGAKMAQRAAGKAVPSAEDLKLSANAAYKQAEDAGVVIGRNRFVDFVDELAADMKKYGIDKDLTKEAHTALNRLIEAKGSRITLEEAEILRQKLDIPAGNKMSSKERFLGSMMKEKFDDFISHLKPEDFSLVAGDKAGVDALVKARDLWSRTRKGELIDNLVDRAKIRAGQFSGSGYENALRTEFRALALNKNKMRGFSEAEQEAIKKAAVGGPIDNLLRYVGKLAPRGVVSGGFHLGTAAAFDPVTAGAVMLAGEGARRAATAATAGNVNRVSELVRNGGVVPTPASLKELPRQVRPLLFGGGQFGGLLLPPVENSSGLFR
jgi:hypothetical protein